MSDGILLGTIGTLATKDDGTAHHQRVMLGGIAQGNLVNLAPAADGTKLDSMFDDLGRLVTHIGNVRDRVAESYKNYTTQGLQSGTPIFAGSAGVFLDLTLIAISNGGTRCIYELSERNPSDPFTVTPRMGWVVAQNGGVSIPFHTPLTQINSGWDWVLNLVTTGNASYDAHVLLSAVKA